MSDNDAKKFKLFKIALWMRDTRDYVIPEGILPENALTAEFEKSARDYAEDFYMVDLVKEIADMADGHHELAKSILSHLVHSGERAAKAGHAVQQHAWDRLSMLQMEEDASLPQPQLV